MIGRLRCGRQRLVLMLAVASWLQLVAAVLPTRRLRASGRSPFGGGDSPFGGDDSFGAGPGGSKRASPPPSSLDHALPGQPMHRLALPERAAGAAAAPLASRASIAKEGELTAAAADLTKATGDLTHWDSGMFQKGKTPGDRSKWVQKHKEILHELLAAADFLHNWEHFAAAHHMPANQTMSSKMVDETLGIKVDHSRHGRGHEGSARARRDQGGRRGADGGGGASGRRASGAGAAGSPAVAAISVVALALGVVLYMSARGAGLRVSAGDYDSVSGSEFRVLQHSAGAGSVGLGGAGGYQYGLDDAGVVDDFDLDDEGGSIADEGGRGREKETESMVADSSFS